MRGSGDIHYAWIEVADDGREILIARPLPGTGLVPLLNRDYDVMIQLRPEAIAHGQATKHVVRLVKYVRDQVLEEITP